ncbi:hypothetical protein ACHWQZ_G002262 [Mnemiopsis leidyi]
MTDDKVKKIDDQLKKTVLKKADTKRLPGRPRNKVLRSPQKTESASDDYCPCKKYMEGELSVECQSCNKYWHLCCVGLKGLSEEMVESLENWQCSDCYLCPHSYKEKNTSTSSSNDCGTMKVMIRDELNAIQPVIEVTVENAVRNILSKSVCSKEDVEGVVKSYAAVAREGQKEVIQQAALAQSSKKVVEIVVRQMDADKVEREKRRSNVVVLSAPEPEKEASAEQKKKEDKRTPLNNPWITFGLIKSINTKDELYESWKKAQKVKCVAPDTSEKPTARNNCDCKTCKKIITCYLEYKAHRQVLKHLINLAKKKFYSDKISEYSGDSKKLWEIINNIRGKSRHEIKPSFKLDDRKITERRLIANEFNKYFVSIATKLNKGYCNDEIPLEGLPSFTDYLPKSCPTSIYLSDCNQNEIMDIIEELKNGKSSDIPINVIKKSSAIISPHLAQLFNDCMKEGIFPDELKLGKVTPIYKKDNEELFENYRPISTLPVFGKILEKSKRKDSLIITPAPSHNFTYKASWLWNLFRNSESDLDFASTSCNSLKSKLNVSLLHAQNRYCSEWHNDNFTEFGPTTS